MCAYKMVTVEFKWWGLQKRVENLIMKVSQMLHGWTNIYRNVFWAVDFDKFLDTVRYYFQLYGMSVAATHLC